MTIASSTNKINHAPDGVQLVFPYDFRVDNATDMVVYLDSVAVPSGWTIDGLGVVTGGNVTFTVAPDGDVLTLLREVPLTQAIDYTPYDAFPAETHEAGLDKLTMALQQQSEAIGRGITAPVSDDGSTDFTLPAYEAGKGIVWDESEQKMVNSDDEINGITAAASASASAALVSETNAAISETNAEVYALSTGPTYDTVALMKAASLGAGMLPHTKGYTSAGDGGGATYLITAPQSFDGYGDHELANGNIAVLQPGGDLSLTQFGVDLSGVTSNSANIQACINKAISVGGGRIRAPAGDYHYDDTLNILVADDEVENVSFIGDGCDTGDAATRFVFKPLSNKTGILIKSGQHITFEGIEFIAGNSNVDECVCTDAYADPVLSSQHVVFKHCSWRSFTGHAVNNALVWLINSVHTSFSHCVWSGDDDAVINGDNAASHPTTYASGGAGSTTFHSCRISGDVRIRRAMNMGFWDCEFGRKVTSTEPSQVLLEGDASCENICFYNNQQVSTNGAGTGNFFEQGVGNRGLVAEGNRLDGYAKTFNVNGDGIARIKYNKFQHGSIAGTIAVQIGATARDVNVHPNDYENIIGGGYVAVDDNRTLPFSPFTVYQDLDVDYTFALNATYETVLSQADVVLDGGFYRATYTLNVINNSSVNPMTWIARLKVGGSIINTSAVTVRQVTGTDQECPTLINNSFVFKRDSTDAAGVAVLLEVRQAGSTTLSTIKASSSTVSSFLLVEQV